MDHDKHERLSTPQGPEDASNIADEYPSPERTPAILHEHAPVEPESQLEEHSESTPLEIDDDNVQHDDTALQAELNHVAAQAIEAAVAAGVRVPSDSAVAVTEEEVAMQISPDANANGNDDVEANPSTAAVAGEGMQVIPSNETRQHHLRNHPHQHNPRQPNFGTSTASTVLGKRYHPSSASPSSSSHHQHLLSQFSASRPRTASAIPKMSQNEQVVILREAYAKNPNPGKKELELLAEKTGRPWNKIREYFRQRRNKLRGLEDLEGMEEPGRASGWLQVAYRQAPPSSSISQLSLYNSYKHRFDPYSITTPLLGGQELIQLACATFPGCEMAKDESEYVLKGLKEKDKEQEGDHAAEDAEEWEKGMEGLVEPLRAGSWLLSSFQNQNDPNAPSTLTQTDLYTSYAARFSSLLTNAGQADQSQSQDAQHQDANQGEDQSGQTQQEQDHAADMRAFEDAGLNDDQQESNISHQQQEEQAENVEDHTSLESLLPPTTDSPIQTQTPTPAPASATGLEPATVSGQTETQTQTKKKENRLLNPYELINLTRMTFPKCEPVIDASGKFVIKGLERRMGHIPGSAERNREMFNFALYNESKPGEAFVNLMKRKLGLLAPEPDTAPESGSGSGAGVGIASPSSGDHAGGEAADRDSDRDRESKRLKISEVEAGGQKQNEVEQAEAGADLLDKLKGEKELDEEDIELIAGLKRFRDSKLGETVRDVCVTQ
ncbi:uncharacterized protein I303_101686 [Kwoniella dejecticola CBS 10117]|uniref:Homeobox domain-containing protein n=1 Tax=Kwoniella dejecticola CBS 10117 TaxID=1296121 RepID=A0A1A6AD16_9TREE|nr:uncharacterized protein I303_02178 [Kwoniella dejecticola CBS 10117]OBR87962.1 hypothetical protein I303_02178 [Kwoniella dejecticola CBS 10117]